MTAILVPPYRAHGYERQRSIREKSHRVILTALLTVIESDITFPADVFSHSGGCHTIPPIPPDIPRCYIGSCRHLFQSTSQALAELAWLGTDAYVPVTLVQRRKEVRPSGPTIIPRTHSTGYQPVNAHLQERRRDTPHPKIAVRDTRRVKGYPKYSRYPITIRYEHDDRSKYRNEYVYNVQHYVCSVTRPEDTGRHSCFTTTRASRTD